MPDEEKAAAEGEAEAPEAPKSKKMLFIIIGAAVAVLGGGGTAFFLMSGSAEPVPVAQTAEQAAAEAVAEAQSELAVLSLDPFVVNLAGVDSHRFAKVSVRMLLPSQDHVDKVKGDRIMVTRMRDRILTLLSSKTFAEINTAVGKESLREELALRVEQSIGGIPVSEVFFADFVVQ